MAHGKIFFVAVLTCLLQGLSSGDARSADFFLRGVSDGFEDSVSDILAEYDNVSDDIQDILKRIEAHKDDLTTLDAIFFGPNGDIFHVDNKTLECLIKEDVKVAAVIAEVKQAVQKCVEAGSKQVEVIKIKLEGMKNQIKEKIEEAKAIYIECKKENPDQPPAVLNCLYIKGAKVGEELKNLLENFQHAVSKIRPQLEAIGAQVRKCAISAAQNGGHQVHEIVQECLKENN